ncbi:hypothetical protein JCM19029_12230 [Salinicoccus sesuvii]
MTKNIAIFLKKQVFLKKVKTFFVLAIYQYLDFSINFQTYYRKEDREGFYGKRKLILQVGKFLEAAPFMPDFW